MIVLVLSLLQQSIGRSIIVPALGEMWYHGVTNRITLEWKKNASSLSSESAQTSSFIDGYDEHQQGNTEERVARLDKSSYRPSAEVLYTISEKGIRDVRRGEKRPAS